MAINLISVLSHPFHQPCLGFADGSIPRRDRDGGKQQCFQSEYDQPTEEAVVENGLMSLSSSVSGNEGSYGSRHLAAIQGWHQGGSADLYPP